MLTSTFRLLLYLLFFPHATPLMAPNKTRNAPTFRTAIIVFVICILHTALVFSISLVIIYLHPNSLRSWAYLLGVLGTLLAAVQFLPQIWTTWKLQEVGSLSIPMMCIQTPGSFIWVGSLAARLGWEGWSTWGIYLVTGVLQGCLLAMSIGFEVRDWKQRKADVKDASNVAAGDGSDANERTRLIDNERR